MKKLFSLILIVAILLIGFMVQPVSANNSVRYERFTPGSVDALSYVYGERIVAQSITATSKHTVESIKLRLSRAAGSNPGFITLFVYATGYEGVPQKMPLSTIWFDGNNLVQSPSSGCVEFTLPYPINWDSGIVYSIILAAYYTEEAQPITIYGKLSGTTYKYDGGAFMESPNNGDLWCTTWQDDAYFEIWGY